MEFVHCLNQIDSTQRAQRAPSKEVEQNITFDLSVFSVPSVVKSRLVILTGQKPFFIYLAETVDAFVFYFYVPLLGLPRTVPPFGICFPDTAVFENSAAEIVCFHIDQASLSDENF